MNVLFPGSSETEDKEKPTNAEPSINWTLCGISIDWSHEFENTLDSIQIHREFDSNVTYESDSHPEPRISMPNNLPNILNIPRHRTIHMESGPNWGADVLRC
jgi:hypothetical protein